MEIIHKELPDNLRHMLTSEPQDCSIYYHSPCQDGFTSAWQVWEFLNSKSLPDVAKFIPINYGTTEIYDLADYSDRIVVFVDFCPSDAKLKEIGEKARWVYIIDHHIGAIERLAKIDMVMSNVFLWMESDRKSGAGLVNEVLGNPSSIITDYVSDRDLWQFKDHNTRAFTDFLMIQEESFNRYHEINSVTELELYEQIKQGCGSIARKFYDIQIILESGLAAWDLMLPFLDKQVYACNIPAFFVSDAADFIREYCGPNANFCGFQYNVSGQTVYLSLRGPNARQIAEFFGGGGHNAAAGANIPVERFIAEKFHRCIVTKDKMFGVRQKLYSKITEGV